MSDLVLLKSKLPAHLQTHKVTANPFAAAASTGFPVISIKGKVFHIQRGDERTMITKPDDDDEPASSIQVVILAANPNKSKVYYEHGYEEGSTDKPDCYSNDGIAPAADAQSPQAKKCATCPHNQWGSRITDNGGKGKACGDSMRLAVAPAGQLNDPMLLRVPAASLKVLGQYGSQLAKRGVDHKVVVTKVGFDYDVAHPALTFKAVDFVTEEQLEEVNSVLESEAEVLKQIIGTAPIAESVETVADVEEAPKPKKKPAPVVEEEDDEEDEAPAPKPKKAKAAPVIEEEDDEEEVEEPKAKKKAKEPEVVDFDNIDDALDNLDFDD